MWFNYATDAKRQPGSSFKPIAAYAPAIDKGIINYSSIVQDEPIPNYFDDGKEWWGTALWSIYDKWMNRFVIIGASLTD